MKKSSTAMKTVKKTGKKRAATATTETNQAKKQRQSSSELNAYFKTYKQGINDFHWPIFRELNKIVNPSRVLYPGCHRHVTASLIFSDVIYIDTYKKIAACFSDPKILEWVDSNKEYGDETKLKFLCKNFVRDFGENVNSFDLVMSLSAGIVTTSCAKYLKKSGYFFVSDAHYDARMLYLNPDFKLTHVWDSSTSNFDSSKETLKGHFTTKDGGKITKAMVQESIKKPKAKRSFKLEKDSLFYLFQKLK